MASRWGQPHEDPSARCTGQRQLVSMFFSEGASSDFPVCFFKQKQNKKEPKKETNLSRVNKDQIYHPTWRLQLYQASQTGILGRVQRKRLLPHQWPECRLLTQV